LPKNHGRRRISSAGHSGQFRIRFSESLVSQWSDLLAGLEETKRWMRVHSFPVRLCAMFVSISLAVICTDAFERSPNGFNIV
jgi:hypothetical protein